MSTIAVVSAGDRMFVGTGDGSLTAHECRGDTVNALKAGSFECRQVRTSVHAVHDTLVFPLRFLHQAYLLSQSEMSENNYFEILI